LASKSTVQEKFPALVGIDPWDTDKAIFADNVNF